MYFLFTSIFLSAATFFTQGT